MNYQRLNGEQADLEVAESEVYYILDEERLKRVEAYNTFNKYHRIVMLIIVFVIWLLQHDSSNVIRLFFHSVWLSYTIYVVSILVRVRDIKEIAETSLYKFRRIVEIVLLIVVMINFIITLALLIS